MGWPARTSSGRSPFSSASYSRVRARSRDWWRGAGWSLMELGCPGNVRTGRPGSGPGQVLARAGVDFDLLTRIHEEGHLDDQAGLEGGRLAGPRHPVTLEAGLGLGDGQFDGGR